MLNQSCLYPSRLSCFFAGKPLYECTEEERKEVQSLEIDEEKEFDEEKELIRLYEREII